MLTHRTLHQTDLEDQSSHKGKTTICFVREGRKEIVSDTENDLRMEKILNLPRFWDLEKVGREGASWEILVARIRKSSRELIVWDRKKFLFKTYILQFSAGVKLPKRKN